MANDRVRGWVPGPHVGKGPKGYRRSDERIREDVGDLLERDPHLDASDIELHVEDGVVVLSGTVEDRRSKRLAEDLVDSVAGVKDVDNRLRISQGRLNELLNDLSASGTTMGRGTTGAGGPVPPVATAPARPEAPPPGRPPSPAGEPRPSEPSAGSRRTPAAGSHRDR